MDIHTLIMGSGSVGHSSNYNISGSNQDIIENETPLDSEYYIYIYTYKMIQLHNKQIKKAKQALIFIQDL